MALLDVAPQAVDQCADAHAEFVARTVVASLERELNNKPRGIAALFELLVDVEAIAGAASLTTGARSYLETFKDSPKLAKGLLKGTRS